MQHWYSCSCTSLLITCFKTVFYIEIDVMYLLPNYQVSIFVGITNYLVSIEKQLNMIQALYDGKRDTQTNVILRQT